MPPVIQSMTAFASHSGTGAGLGWTWEMRGVNGRGLDLRLRLPEGCEALEAPLRSAVTARVARGNVTLNLRLVRASGEVALTLDPVQLDRVLGALEQVQDRAAALGVTLAQPTVTDVLAWRGVVLADQAAAPDQAAVNAALLAEIGPLLDAFITMRSAEGAALAAVLDAQLATIARLSAESRVCAEARRDDARAILRAALRRVFEDVPEMDEARIAQELALIAVKSDVTEELDRLDAHVAAARALLADDKPAGRRLDFLAQEFNREANTLCSKAQSAELTRIGLELKAVIDQMREQIQNVE